MRGEETSLNPLGLVDALIGSINYAAELSSSSNEESRQIYNFTSCLRKAIENTFRYGQGTRDMAGPEGLTTEMFIDKVAWRLGRYIAAEAEEMSPKDLIVPSLNFKRNDVDRSKLEELFKMYDHDKKGMISMDDLEVMLVQLGVAPMKDLNRKNSAKDKVAATTSDPSEVL